MRKTKWNEIAKWLGVSKSYISRIKNGKMEPSPKEAARLKEVSGISMDVWFGADTETLKRKLHSSYLEHTQGDLK